MRRWAILFAMAASLSGCAYLHKVQIGDIDNRKGVSREPFDIKVSELGINLDEASQVAKSMAGSKARGQIDDIQRIVSLFQMGPRTGNPVFNPDFAKKIGEEILEVCPSGRVTGLTSIRETARYPVVSGEIVRITGICLKNKG